MGKLVVVDGAILRCDKGALPSPLKVTTPFTSFTGSALTATITDKEPGDNIKPFGICAITKKTCHPITPSPWQPGESSVFGACLIPILCEDSFLTCSVGGIIQIQSPGQSFFTVDSQNQVIYDELGVPIGFIRYGVDDEDGIPRATATYHDADGNVVGKETEDPVMLENGIGSGLRPLASKLLGKGVTKSKVGVALFGAARRTISRRIPAAIREKLERRAAEKVARRVTQPGARHGGTYRNYVGRPSNQIQKGIRSMEKEIAEHKDKIANPEKYIRNFRKLDPRQQKALVREKWPNDIIGLRERKAVLERILRERGGG
jgi:hypothetical protein